MKNYKNVNKIYYNMFIKNNLFKQPYFIMKYKTCYYVFQNINSLKRCFMNYEEAVKYINYTEYNPIIIVLPTKND